MPFIDLQESQDRRLQMLLQTANQIQQNKIAREELALKKQQLDPEYQRRQLAQTIGILNPDAAVRLFGPTQGQAGTALPSQIQGGIPDYLGAGQPRLNSGSVGIGPTKANVKVGGTTISMGAPEMSEIDKANLDIHKQVVAEGAKKKQEQEAGLNRTLKMEDVYLNQYAKSYDELKKFDPEIGRTGAGGWASRQYAKLMKNIDELPQTKALEDLANPIAQEIAAALEGRATDKDRDTQKGLLVSALAGPTEQNITTAANNILLMEAKGADIKPYVDRLAKSRIPILKSIAKQVHASRPELNSNKVDLDNLFEGV